jgi:hypothetical protein
MSKKAPVPKLALEMTFAKYFHLSMEVIVAPGTAGPLAEDNGCAFI